MKNLITAGIAVGLISVTALAQAQQPTQGQQAAQAQQPAQTQQPARTPADIKEAEKTISEWVDVRSTIAQEANNWRVDQRLLQQQIELYQSEIKELEGEIASLADKAAAGQNRRAELSQKMEQLQRAQSVVEGQLGSFERKLRQLSEYFPAPLMNTLRPLMASLPTDSRNAKGGVGNRMAVVVGILNEVDKFNNDVTVVRDMRDIGGESIEVNVMYLGLGEAFYANSEGTFAGVGIPAKGGWKWQERNDLAPQIAQAVAVAHGDIKPAVYSELPLQVTTVDAIQ